MRTRGLRAVLAAWLVAGATFAANVSGPTNAVAAADFEVWDTAWMLPNKASPSDVVTYLDHLAAVGFDGFWVTVVPFYWSGGVTRPNYAGETFGRGDPDLGFPPAFEDPNPAYLDHIEFIIDQAAARGLKTGLVVAWGADFSGSRPGIGEHAPPPWDDWLDHSGLPADNDPSYPSEGSKAYRYGELLAERWKDRSSVVWVMGGDYMNGDTEYLAGPTWSHVVRGLRDHGAGQDATYLSGGFESSWYRFAGEWWQDFLAPHLGHCNNAAEVESFISDLVAAYPNKRIISSESRYEDELAPWCLSPPNGWQGVVGPQEVAADAQAVLDGGGHGVVYGHSSRWNWNGEQPNPTPPLQSLGSAGEALVLAIAARTGNPHDPDYFVLVEPNGQWHLRYPDGSVRRFYYGGPGDVPLMGDWNGNGVDTPGLYRPSSGSAYLTNQLPPPGGVGFADASLTFSFGMAGDQVFVGDWNGDRIDTLGIRRGGKVYLTNTNATGIADMEFWFGVPADLAFGGDPDSDGRDSVFLYRPSSGFTYYTNSTPVGPNDLAPTHGTLSYGVPTDRLVIGDWDGDGTDTVGVFRPSETTVYLRNTNTTGPAEVTYVFGEAPWQPLAGFWS
jgi:hypothetical protein